MDVAELRGVGQGVAHVGIFHVAVGADEAQGLAVDKETAFARELDAADADARFFAVDGVAAVAHFRNEEIECRRGGRPEAGLTDSERLPLSHGRPRGEGEGLLAGDHAASFPFFPAPLVERLAQGELSGTVALVGHFGLDADGRLVSRNAGVGDEYASAGRLVGQDGVRDVDGGLGDESGVAIEAAVVAEVQVGQGLSGRYERVVAVVEAHDDFVVRIGFEPVRDVGDKGRVAAGVLCDVAAVDPEVGQLHGALKLQPQPFAGQFRGQTEVPAVVADTLPLTLHGERLDRGRMRQRSRAPCALRQLVGLATQGVGGDRQAVRGSLYMFDVELRSPVRALRALGGVGLDGVEALELPARVERKSLGTDVKCA